MGSSGRAQAPTASARRYLYGLLTGCGLVTATPPCRLSAGSLGRYSDFVLGHLRRHPLPRPRRRVRCTLTPAAGPAARPPGQQPGVICLDPAWLRREYLAWHRSPDAPLTASRARSRAGPLPGM